jgi:hypothetical protein
LFDNVLTEQGYSREQIRVLFNEGPDSLVKDPFSKKQNNRRVNEEYGVLSETDTDFRPTLIKDIINGPANLLSIKEEFARAVSEAEEGKLKRVVLFTTDHGTPNKNVYTRSYVTLVGRERLTLADQESFVQELGAAGAEAALVGVQCFSGHNMEIALRHSNACAFAAASPFETSYALDKNEIPKGSQAPVLGYSAYSLLFSCALHHSKVQGNLASAHCPAGVDADFNADGRISLSEAHFFAVLNMAPTSAPQISSQVYAQSVLEKKNRKLAEADLGLLCSHLRDPAQAKSLVEMLGSSFDPVLKSRIEARLATERRLFAKLFEDSELLKKIQAAPRDSLNVKLQKLKTAYEKFDKDYWLKQADIRSALANGNKIRDEISGFKEEILRKLLQDGSDANLKTAHRELQESQKKLENPALSPEQKQIWQASYDRNYQLIEDAIESELKKDDSKGRFQELGNKDKNQFQALKKLMEGEREHNREFSGVRRAYESVRNYYAEAEIMKSGSSAEKAKLVQLYECEDQTL